MTLTRIPACTTKGCPAPRDPDWHKPWCGHGTAGHHHHVPKRSQGGKKIVAFLCPECHDKVDNTPDFDNDITPGENGRLEYILWDTRVEGGWNSPLICRPIGPAAGEQSNSAVTQVDTPAAGPGREEAKGGNISGIPSICPDVSGSHARNRGTGRRPDSDTVGSVGHLPGPIGGELGAESIEAGQGEAGGAAAGVGAVNPDTRRDTVTDSAAAPPASPLSSAGEGREVTQNVPLGRQEPLGSAEVAQPLEARSGGQPSPAEPFSKLTHDERIAIAAEIRREQKQRQWKAGDTANLWERETTEAWQYLDDFGYTHPALSNIMHVCENIPGSRRKMSLSFAHHAVIHTYNAEDQEAWLERAEQEGWTVRDFRVAVHGEKPKVKRWTINELREQFDIYITMDPDSGPPDVLLFLGWLEAK